MQYSSEETKRRQRKHIFVVNGSPLFLDMIRLFLNDLDYNVTTTNFVPRTFQQIQGLQPDLLIIDLSVTQESAWDLLEQIRAESDTRAIPVVVLSTDRSLLSQAEAQQERFGGNLFLAKPFNLDDLLEGIRSLIGEA